jgi:uncharacterized protein (DUF433 family)
VKVRTALLEAKKESKAEYPLLEKNILICFGRILMEKPPRGKQPYRLIDLTSNRQLCLEQILKPFATRIQWDSDGKLAQIFPWRYWEGVGDKSQPVTINPEVMSGRLVLTGTRVPVQIVAARQARGETFQDLADDYRVGEDIIRGAVRHLVPQAA